MIHEKYLCPKCGGEPRGTIETIPGVALVDFNDEGHPYYAGETDVCWDGQTTETDGKGHVIFQCGDCDHEYPVEGVTSIADGDYSDDEDEDGEDE